VFKSKGDYAKAIVQNDKVLAVDPKNMKARAARAYAYLDMGQGEKALEEFVLQRTKPVSTKAHCV
jgi:Tfp pilus assembly protein PilF